jgi:murein DD-endopeptidase MepM/ murein hydrolase activator NlpD
MFKAKVLSILLIMLLITGILFSVFIPEQVSKPVLETGYIKWVEFKVPYSAMEKALNIDIKSYQTDMQIHWVELLACLAGKYYGHWEKYKTKDMDTLVKRLKSGERTEDITKDMEYYPYYREAYSAILGGFVGEYEIEVIGEDGETKEWQRKYGLKAFSPIAKGYGYSHYDDFGDSRSFGYRRPHLGNDLMGSVGTPIIAIESGTVEAMGWNMYGGWRIGIRSFDKKRYYYYAHLRKDKPYHTDMHVGQSVQAGDVIGYLGMTGYSTKENTNNIKKPHLHVGMELVFDESQKESISEIWIDMYNIVRLLYKNRSAVQKNEENKQFYRVYDMREVQ